MFSIEFWKCVWDLIVLLRLYLKKDTYYGTQLVEDSILECVRDMRSLKCFGCHYWARKEKQDDIE